MTRHRFRAADPSQRRSLPNDPAVEAARRRRRSIAASVMLAGAIGLDFLPKAEAAARGRVAPADEKAAHNSLAAGLAFHAHEAGKNPAASSRRRSHDIHTTLTNALRRRPCLS
jgi:hypothetical protein